VNDSALAEARVVRTIVIVLGVAVAIYALLSAGTVLAEAKYVHPAWLFPAVIIVFGVPPVLATISGRISLRVMHLGLALYTIAFLVVVVTWVPAMRGDALPLDAAPWPLGITAVGTVPAAIVWRPAIAWLVVIANSMALAIVRYFSTGALDLQLALQDGLFCLVFSSIFTIVAIVAIRNARALDAAALTARASAARAASVAARMHEHARLDALVHDELITALYYATTDRGELTGSVQVQARRALDELGRLDAERGEPAPVESAAFASRLRSVLLDLSSGLMLTVRGQRTALIPADVADAFAEGATEALRNSLRHAGGGGVRRHATLSLSEERVVVEVGDDGSGFDPHSVNPYRLGILVSIRGRLDAVKNGSASVRSTPGAGTVVTLTWNDR